MEILFNEKPPTDIIDKYCSKIEYFLSGIGVKINIEVNNIGPLSSFYVDNVLVSQTRWWLGDFIISTPWGVFKSKNRPRLGIEDSIDDHEIWRDATMIQDEIYKHFKLEIGNPIQDGRYWSLWGKIPKQ